MRQKSPQRSWGLFVCGNSTKFTWRRMKTNKKQEWNSWTFSYRNSEPKGNVIPLGLLATKKLLVFFI